MRWPKVCGCGRSHSEAEWAALPSLGHIGGFQSGGRLFAVELKNCACHSTLGVEVELRRSEAA